MTETKNTRENEWMIKPCDFYEEEYKDCKSIKGRFHQYFIFGEFLDCSQWKMDYENCNKWYRQRNETAFIDLIESEKQRRIERLRPHYQNTVWKKREKPPENWNAPLPEWMQKKFEGTYLYHKAKEEKGTITSQEKGQCTIL